MKWQIHNEMKDMEDAFERSIAEGIKSMEEISMTDLIELSKRCETIKDQFDGLECFEYDKLKPCPFCNDTYIRVHFMKGGKYVVGCNTLNCICLHSEGKSFSSAKKAIEAWNRRVSDDKTRGD